MAFLPLTASAQSAAEIKAAKAMAQSYGYSEKEMNAILNHSFQNNSGFSSTEAPVTGDIPDRTTQLDIQNGLTVRSLSAVDDMPSEMMAEDSSLADPNPSGDIYGHSYFTSSGLSIIPSYNAPVPAAYVLGPGDDLTIDIWGATVSHMAATIGNDGSISVSDLGPVYLAGMKLSTAESFLKEQLSRIYSGLAGNYPDTYLRLSIGKIKGVSVNVSGEVATPGVYSIPSLATIPSVIFMAGGVQEKGSVRNIALFRHGRRIADFDLYDFLFKGRFNENLRLQDGDVINVEAYHNVVSVEGAVMRPMRYEMKEGESVSDLLSYADGFSLEAQRSEVHVYRRGVLGNKGYNVPESDFSNFRLMDGDRVSIRTYSANDVNSVTITGPVKYPGSYAIESNTRDVASLIDVAGGLLDGAYLRRGQIKRLDADRLPSFVTFNLSDVLSGKTVVLLEREDSVFLYSKRELVEDKTVTIEGHVQNPNTFEYSDGMTVADLILQAHGVREDTYGGRGHIRRRNADGVPVLVPFNVDDALSGNGNVTLEREDTVRIYSMGELRDTSKVRIGGIVNRPGTFQYYEGMTLEDLILMAGNFADGADMRNLQISSRGGRERGKVEIVNLEENPEQLSRTISPYDIVSVRRLTYFRSQMTITVNGEVMSPGPYAFDEAEVRLSDVLARVGGFTDAAYIRGAKLTRVLTDEERERQQLAVMIANQNLDGNSTIDLGMLADRFHIGIDLPEALNNPGSVSDVTLRDGDIIDIPVFNNTVKVSGGVFYPNTVAFDSRKTWRGYVHQAGGFTKLARKAKTYAVYMNGKVAVGANIKNEPGMELIVPEKTESENHKMSPVEIASIASSSTSVATLVASLVKLFL